MMKKVVVACFVFGVTQAWSDAPALSGVSVYQDAATRCVRISYTLSGGPAYVTLDGMSVSGEELEPAVFRDDVHGAVNAKVPSGEHVALWRPDRHAWEGHQLEQGQLSASLSVWAADTPPDYAVVDLCVSNALSYYSSTNMLPGGVSGREYRDGKLLMRRIPAKDVVWRMGSPSDEKGSLELRAAEIPHYVKLTEDYWIGVFKVTSSQLYRINRGWLSDYTAFSNVVDFALLPANYISYNLLRGSHDTDGIDWPGTGHDVKSSSLIGKLRSMTGIMFDLPTDAQWEYACRAGTGDPFCFGGGMDLLNENGSLSSSEMEKWCWFYMSTTNATYHNSASSDADVARAPMPVGLKPPNGFGLYDMIGNGDELVLDAYSEGETYLATFGEGYVSASVVEDPKGHSLANGEARRRVIRSQTPTGNFTDDKCRMRSASRSSVTEGNRYNYLSFRVACQGGGLP